ncbi:MAG: hypothetical protein JW818_07990 [Pirellulales bacterium]|nr:hypothetical protein [Pirellulales bacterium]
MKIAVVLRQVPDLIEPLEIVGSGNALDLDGASFLVNESDDHALEQAILLKESAGATVDVVALDFGDVDNTLYSAAAKGVDRLIKITLEDDKPPAPKAAAAMLAQAIGPIEADLVLIGCQAHDELQGALGPVLALKLGLPYLGVVRGVTAGDGGLQACKEFPGAVMARMNVQLPAVLGILAAESPPRYVPVSRIRAAMKSTQFDEQPGAAEPTEPAVVVRRMYHPEPAERAEMLVGSEAEVAGRIADILIERGIVK